MTGVQTCALPIYFQERRFVGLLLGVPQDLFRVFRRDDADAVPIAHDNVPGIRRDAAAGDGDVDLAVGVLGAAAAGDGPRVDGETDPLVLLDVPKSPVQNHALQPEFFAIRLRLSPHRALLPLPLPSMTSTSPGLATDRAFVTRRLSPSVSFRVTAGPAILVVVTIGLIR